MQHPAVPELAHAHTRTRPVHWLATAAALAGVVALSTLVQPRDATAAAQPAPPPASAPDAAAVDYPMECGAAARPQVQRQASADLDGDGRPETVAVARCAAGSGTPPSGVYVITGATTGTPRVVATLVDPADRLSVSDFAVRDDTVTATLLGYSSPDVPRCCPDQKQRAKWQWKDGAFVRSPQASAHRA
ncbi:hypothetical protein ACX6XY_00045 [Streptomyces sp. O3]